MPMVVLRTLGAFVRRGIEAQQAVDVLTQTQAREKGVPPTRKKARRSAGSKP